MSKELKICKQFQECFNRSCYHKRKRVRKKNRRRAEYIFFNKAIKKFGSLPIPPEWR